MLYELEETCKAAAAADIQSKFDEFSAAWSVAYKTVSLVRSDRYTMNEELGSGFFTRKGSDTFLSALNQLFDYDVPWTEKELSGLQRDFNQLVNQNSIASIEDAVSIYQKYTNLYTQLEEAGKDADEESNQLETLKTQFNSLPVNFPTADQVYNIVPANLDKELQ